MKLQDEVKKEMPVEKEVAPPAIENIKQDAMKKPEQYIKDYKIPAEGE
ncbi:MAG: hypothetical protein RDV48_29605 [Candidatus Eremiobacteraeota bacterium]|nr:hypothetical protein [Candidatus Eremiobacteraeota bacterium]